MERTTASCLYHPLRGKVERHEMLRGRRACVERSYYSPHGKFSIHIGESGFLTPWALEDACWLAMESGSTRDAILVTRALWDEIPEYKPLQDQYESEERLAIQSE